MSRSNASAIELCPLDNRRSSTEVLVKQYIVQFTTAVALCHFHSIRGERILTWRTVYFLYSPISVAIRYALGLALIFIEALVFIICARYHVKRHFTDPAASFNWLFRVVRDSSNVKDQRGNGNVADSEDQDSIGDTSSYAAPPTSAPISRRRQALADVSEGASSSGANNEGSDIASHDALPKQDLSSILGRSVVVLAFLIQCCTTIHLYNRRSAREACTLVDVYIFEAAISGIVIAFLTLGQVWELPFMRTPVPDSLPETWVAKVIAFLRGISHATQDMHPYSHTGATLLAYMGMLRRGIPAWKGILLPSPAIVRSGPLRDVPGWITFSLPSTIILTYQTSSSFSLFFRTPALILHIVLLAPLIVSDSSDRHRALEAFIKGMQAWIIARMPPWTTSVHWPEWTSRPEITKLIALVSRLYRFLYALLRNLIVNAICPSTHSMIIYGMTWGFLVDLHTAPVDKPCPPYLWTDPLQDKVWSLA